MRCLLLPAIGLLLLAVSCKKSPGDAETPPDSFFSFYGKRYNTKLLESTDVGIAAYDSIYTLGDYHAVHILHEAGQLQPGRYRIVDSIGGGGEVVIFTEGPEPLFKPGVRVPHFAAGHDSAYITVSSNAGYLRVIVPPLWVKIQLVGPPNSEDSFQLSADLAVKLN